MHKARGQRPYIDPIIMELVAALPPAGMSFSPEERAKWLRAMEAAFDLIYDDFTPPPNAA